MAKQTTPVHRPFRTAIPAPAAPHRPSPPTGDRLGKAVATALTELSTTPDPEVQLLRQLDDLLLGALAWTAATGDTCRVDAAAHAVRAARGRIAAADVTGARAELSVAVDELGRPR